MKAIRIHRISVSEHFGTGTALPVPMSEGQVRNEESFESGQSLEAYNIHLSRNVRETVCEPKPCAFFHAFSSPLIFLFALKLEEMQSGVHQTCFSDREDGAKSSPRETPFIDNSLAQERK